MPYASVACNISELHTEQFLIYLKNRGDNNVDWEILFDEVVIEIKGLFDISVVIISVDCTSV